MKGKVKFFNHEKGYGFITGEDDQDVFVHQTSLEEGLKLQDEEPVTFDVEQGDRGAKAVNVKRAEEE